MNQAVHPGHVAFEFRQLVVRIHRIERSGDNGEGRSKLVGSIGRELALNRKALLEAVQSPIHGAHERCDLAE